MHFSKLTVASLVALLASVSTVSASPADGAYAGGFPAGGYGNPSPVANAAAPAPSPAAGAPAPAAGAPAAGAPAAGAPAAPSAPAVPVASPSTVPVGTLPPAPAAGVPAAATGKVFTVMVGNGNFTFIPKNFMASVGDTISFVWTGGNHSVVQSTKADLCTKKGPDAFASGSHGPPFSWNITVNSTDPLWYYCGVPNHCQGKGMYAAVNFPADQAFPTPAGAPGAAGNATGNGTSTDAPKSAATSLTSMSTSALLAGALALGAFLL